VRASAGVSFYVVISMNQRFAGEARQVILAAMSSNIRPKWIVIVDPDIDVHSRPRWNGRWRSAPSRSATSSSSTDSGRAVRSLDRRADQAAAVPHCLVNRHRRHQALRQAVLGSLRRAGWEDFEMPELDDRR
jgi:4-hydroxy-3-polyprenylbenzoate decarboxylase/2,5-furandicarboxylate decarboxylase 1